MRKSKPCKKRQFHESCALAYRGIRVYHTYRDFAGGPHNRTPREFWFSWKFADRDSDNPKPGNSQFDIRDFTQPSKNYKPKADPIYIAPGVKLCDVLQLQFSIDGALCSRH